MLDETVRDNLIKIATAYGRATGLTLSQVSKRAYGAGSFLLGLKSGQQSITVRRLDEMLDWFSTHWPAGAKWPFLPAVMMTRRKVSGQP